MNGEVKNYDQAGSVKTVHRDPAGRITGIQDSLRADLNQSFTYDDLDHLSEYRVGSSAALERKFTYDVEGNRKTVELGGKLYTYAYADGTNYLGLAPGPVARQWALLDNVGKTFTDGKNVFTLDAYRRIASVKNSKGTTAYLRDYTGRRVSKKLPDGSTIHYVHDADGHLIAEVNGSGTTLVEYIWLGDTPVAVWKNGALYYIYADHLNTPRAVTDTANTVRWTWYSEPFGSSLPNESPNGMTAFTFNLRFPGQYFDVESGLHYNYFRDYDPQTGRYVESDPIGLDGGINTYGYVGANPISNTDPMGLATSIRICVNGICPPGPAPGIIDPVTREPWASVVDDGDGRGRESRSRESSSPANCPDDNERCKMAEQKARSTYWDLTTKRIPQYLNGGTNGSDPGHYNGIAQKQSALRDAIRRVKLYCKPLPPELPQWEQAANQSIPQLHN